jgi:hypothetical protein
MRACGRLALAVEDLMMLQFSWPGAIGHIPRGKDGLQNRGLVGSARGRRAHAPAAPSFLTRGSSASKSFVALWLDPSDCPTRTPLEGSLTTRFPNACPAARDDDLRRAAK